MITNRNGFIVLCLVLAVPMATATIARAVKYARDGFLEAIGRGLAFVVTPRPTLAAPAVLLVRSRSFLRRTIKRDAPRIESTFRLCPSV